MKTQGISALGLALLAIGAMALGPQTLERIPEVTFERATTIDANGLQQFTAYDLRCDPCQGLREVTCQGCDKRDLPGCQECKGTKRAPCRNCAGTGKLLDPLVEHACMFCLGSGWYDCAQCNGFGAFFETTPDGSRTEVNCGACKRAGRFHCSVCDGKRRIDTVRVKRKLPSEASLADLRQVRAELDACMKELEPFEPLDRGSQTTKALEKVLARPGRTLPPLKDMLALLAEVQKGLSRAGAGYQNFAERQNHQFLVFRNRSVHLLRHQLRVLDLCIARAEFNEKAGKSK